MTVTSFYFLVFIVIGAAIYYIVPKKVQWLILLGLSFVFYYFSAVPYTIIYLLLSTLIAYITTIAIEKYRDKRTNIAVIACTAIIFNIVIWFLLKGNSFWSHGVLLIEKTFPSVHFNMSVLHLTAAFGMGYYTAQVIGYILDCYWEISKPQKNPFKLFLFVCFFPQLTVGPISKYSQLECLYREHRFSYKNICFGSQRILWGMFKKLVVSDRIAIITTAIWADTISYSGVWPWIAVFLYPIQLYGDFSGCVDIILGTAEIFDIKLPENFNNPFKSCSVQEFWQRWHITLGTWAKDYVYYPVLKSKYLISIGKWSKKHFTKRIAKLIPWTLGMGVLWLVMGIWHGSVRHIAGVSLWYWGILVLGEFFGSVFKNIVEYLNIKSESYSWVLLQRIRTYAIFSAGSVFFAAESFRDALFRYQTLFASIKNLNPWTLFDGTVIRLGVTWGDVNIIILGIFLLHKIDTLREKEGMAREWMQKQIVVFRWGAWISLFFLVLIYGLYGPGYEASQFIYQGF